MKYKNILLTGGSGKLGIAIIKSGYFHNILAPSSKVLDLTNPSLVGKFFKYNKIDAIIHCAALARMIECENDPIKAMNVNMIGTFNLVKEVIKIKSRMSAKQSFPNIPEKQRNVSEFAVTCESSTFARSSQSSLASPSFSIKKKGIRFIYISTDAVYPGKKGNYSEKDETIPYNKYGWTKLGAECAVNLLSNFCIIRTSFFDPNNIVFDKSLVDIYSSKMNVNELVKAICDMIENDFIGTINIGNSRKSDFARYKEFKPFLKTCKAKDITKNLPFNMASDASLNISLWNEIKSRHSNQPK